MIKRKRNADRRAKLLPIAAEFPFAMPADSLIDSFCQEFAQITPFDRIAAAPMRALAAVAKLAYYPGGTVVCAPTASTEYGYLVKEGRIGSAQADGEAGEYGRGDFFPLDALLTGTPVPDALLALEDCFVYQFPRASVEALRQASDAFADYCLNRLGHLLVRSRQQQQSRLALDTRQSAMNMTLGQIMTPPVSCAPDTPLIEALARMQSLRIGSILVADADGVALGIYTLQDLLHTVLGGGDLSAPINAHMHAPLVTMTPDGLASDAAVTMARHRFRHIPVVEQAKLVGMVSERDLYGLQRVSLGSIDRQLATADSTEDFAEVARQIRRLSTNLLAQGLAAEPLARLVSTLFDRLTARLAAQRLEPLRLEGIALCWLAFGSEGRQEQTLSGDQDNGLLFRAPAGMTADACRARLLGPCTEINHVLDRCGIVLCPGGIMAMNAACCLSLDEWQARFTQWIDQGGPADLLAANIFFDFRPIWGDETLVTSLQATLVQRVSESSRFLWLLTRNALQHEPPLGLIRDFVTQQANGQAVLDLKASGTVFFVDAARILALAAGVAATSTAERLRQAGAALGIPPARIQSWVDAFQFLQTLRLNHQEAQMTAGCTPDNLVNPDDLTALDRRILREALTEARWLQRQLAQRWPA